MALDIEKRKQYLKEYYLNNKEKINQCRKEWGLRKYAKTQVSILILFIN
jgi:hypothetical protein